MGVLNPPTLAFPCFRGLFSGQTFPSSPKAPKAIFPCTALWWVGRGPLLQLPSGRGWRPFLYSRATLTKGLLEHYSVLSLAMRKFLFVCPFPHFGTQKGASNGLSGWVAQVGEVVGSASGLPAAFIKIAQAVSMRPDLLSPVYAQGGCYNDDAFCPCSLLNCLAKIVLVGGVFGLFGGSDFDQQFLDLQTSPPATPQAKEILLTLGVYKWVGLSITPVFLTHLSNVIFPVKRQSFFQFLVPLV